MTNYLRRLLAQRHTYPHGTYERAFYRLEALRVVKRLRGGQ